VASTLFLNCYKWYQSNLIKSCSVEVLHGVNLDENAMDLSDGDYDTPKSLSKVDYKGNRRC
jgi:hypothetical protein